MKIVKLNQVIFKEVKLPTNFLFGLLIIEMGYLLAILFL